MLLFLGGSLGAGAGGAGGVALRFLASLLSVFSTTPISSSASLNTSPHLGHFSSVSPHSVSQSIHFLVFGGAGGTGGTGGFEDIVIFPFVNLI
jgi:hypothetical protein